MTDTEKTFNPADYLTDFKGRDYLPVAARLLWLRTEAPDSIVHTDMVQLDGDGPHARAIFRSEVTVIKGGEVLGKATGWGSETANDFGDYLEKAETKAVGRALAALGYGTQFAIEDLDEGERIVDTPQDRGGRGGGFNNRGSQQAAQGRPQGQPNPQRRGTDNPEADPTSGQIRMTRTMAGERGLTENDLHEMVRGFTDGKADYATMNRGQASILFEELKKIPRTDSDPRADADYYYDNQ